MTSITLGQPLAGCEVAGFTAAEVVLRCPCGQTFPIPREGALARKAAVRCPECVVSEQVPMAGTKMRRVYHLIVTHGMTPGQAAAHVRVAPQTADRVMERFVIPNRLRARIAELEAQLAGRKSA